MNFGVDLPWPVPDLTVGGTIINSNPSLKSNTDFTYATGSQIKGTAEYAPTVGSLGFDAVVAGVGVDLKVNQDVYFTPQDIAGTLVYTHLETGRSETAFFHARDSTWSGVTVPLDSPGYWALTLRDLTLVNNSFYTSLGMAAGINMWATFFGNAGFSLDLDIYRSNPFPLTFNRVDALGGSLLVYVNEWQPDPVPEPGTVALLGSGLIALVGFHRGWKRSA
jgi:hypothetical protein